MKQIDRILQYIADNTRKFSEEDLLRDEGITAIEIAGNLNMLRNNVSKELNNLLRADLIVKIKGRPVKFLHKQAIEDIFGIQLKEKQIEVNSVKEVLSPEEQVDPFHALIGSKQSLRNQVEQGKAAILYPPGGLHTLIVGQTGVGKTLFARLMYNYGKHMKRFTEDAPYIVFNCADYYNNPQLLLSHIFGHVKGAFTGAEHEKEGLVEKANGGILFLDEIHRLPPEGQEMIFYFMDTHTYNKLGESERNRKANVLLIGATTEDPGSSMLKTFIRRIPITINIPPLQERTIEERLLILKHLFATEAHRVNKPINVATEVVKALIGSVSYGNIGQLKSNIQLICAKGFLNSINENKDEIDLDFKILPSNIREGLFDIGKNRKEIEEIGAILSRLHITPEGSSRLHEDDSSEPPFNLYKLIEDKMGMLKEEGLDDNYINKFITTDVNIHIKSIYNRFYKNKGNRERILKIVDKDILEFAEQVKELVEKELKRKYNDRFVYAFSLHLSAFFKRIQENKYDNKQIYESIEDKDEEYRLALIIKDLIESKFAVRVPEAEITYVSILLKSVEERQGNVGIIVAAHGNSTASSMVNVAESLLGSSNICAVDMPLDVSPKEILETVIAKVKTIDNDKGVLLLVDMGSLVKFETTITERTGIKVRTIDMVSTPLILEAVRKASIFDMEMEDIYQSLKDFRGYNDGNAAEKSRAAANKVIVTVCSSGKGAAVKLKEFVEKVVFDLTEEKVHIVTATVRELDKVIKDLQEKYSILAVVGVKRPTEKQIPFIPLEKLIEASGEQMLRELLLNNSLPVLHPDESVVVKDLCEDSLKEFLTYLNPHKILNIMMKFIQELERELQMELDHAMKIRIVIHTAHALERMIIRDGLIYREDRDQFDQRIVDAVKRAGQVFVSNINLTLSDDENYYICEMLSEVYQS